MKKLHLVYVILIFVFSCNSQSAQEKGAVSLNGAFLKATIDGKKWTASKMKNYNAGSDYKLVNGETDDITISFQIHKPTTGMKRPFRDDYVADFITDDGFFGGRTGEVTITKVDAQWIEGNFHFTATSTQSTKTYKITDGSFRIPNQ